MRSDRRSPTVTVAAKPTDPHAHEIVVDPVWGFRRLEPLPTSPELDAFYESHYRDLLDDGGRAPDLARLVGGGPDATIEREWQAATIHADVLAALDMGADDRVATTRPRRGLRDRRAAARRWSAPAGRRSAPNRRRGSPPSAARPGSRSRPPPRRPTSPAGVPRATPPFDGIVLLNVLEHVPDPATLLGDVTSALAPGGILVVRVPNDFSALQEAAHRRLGGRRWWIAIPDHVNYFDHASIAGLVERIGLDVVDRSADFPMELFLLMGDDYRDDPVVGHAVHDRRRRAELAMDPATRRALGRAWAAAGVGRNALIVARKPRVIAPDRPNVLVTSAARKVLLVRAFADALARTGSGRVIAADIDPLAAALYAADAGRLIPRSDDPSFVDALLGICDVDRVGLIVPTRDEELPILARAASRFEAAGTRVLVSAADAVDTCRDKRRFVDAVRAAGLDRPGRLRRSGRRQLPGVRQAAARQGRSRRDPRRRRDGARGRRSRRSKPSAKRRSSRRSWRHPSSRSTCSSTSRAGRSRASHASASPSSTENWSSG